MKHIYPNYYEKFKCIADRCPDSCCKDWDVVVDDTSDEYYRSVKGKFGNKLRNLTVTDSDGDRIFILQNGRCPFWNDKMLCDIFINLGEEHLCATCRNFPRITQNYTVFSEHLLSFACPESARLMICENNAYNCFKSYDFDFSDVDYDAELMLFLLKAREKNAEILKNKSISFAERLKQCLIFNSTVQEMIDNENFSADEIPWTSSIEKTLNKPDCSFIFELHKRLDIMNKEWHKTLEEVSAACGKIKIPADFDNEFENLGLYYIFRYYLTATDSYDVISCIKRIVCAYIVISQTEAHIIFKEGGIDFNHRVMLMQQYSKEVEHSYENSEILESEFFTSSDFSIENLINLL